LKTEYPNSLIEALAASMQRTKEQIAVNLLSSAFGEVVAIDDVHEHEVEVEFDAD